MSTDRHSDDPGSQLRVRALRGATTASADDPEEIVAATEELLRALLERNDAVAEDLISIVFTATPDLSAAFPAAAARRLGLDAVPLLGATEMAVDGAVPRCIRVLAHLYTARAAGELEHVYLREARDLRAGRADGSSTLK